MFCFGVVEWILSSVWNSFLFWCRGPSVISPMCNIVVTVIRCSVLIVKIFNFSFWSIYSKRNTKQVFNICCWHSSWLAKFIERRRIFFFFETMTLEQEDIFFFSETIIKGRYYFFCEIVINVCSCMLLCILICVLENSNLSTHQFYTTNFMKFYNK